MPSMRSPGDRGASLRLRGVCYDGSHRSCRDVPHGLDLDVAPGERLAVLGCSGAGKSTLLRMICGRLTPMHGSIELDGTALAPEALATLVTTVRTHPLRPSLAGEPILENVRAGRPRLSSDDILRALEAVALLEEVAGLPDGLQTRLAVDGSPLSKAQCRRLLLARTIVGGPRLLLIDELFDSNCFGRPEDAARRKVFETLFDRSAPWTLLVVTHRRDVAARCDRAVVLARGRGGHRIDRMLDLANGQGPS